METNEFLLKRSYRYYPQKYEYPYEWSALYEHRLTDFETNAVCQTNNRLCIHVHEYKFIDQPLRYTVEIVAERKNLWWTLNCYSMDQSTLENQIEFIENTLIKIFNTI